MQTCVQPYAAVRTIPAAASGSFLQPPAASRRLQAASHHAALPGKAARHGAAHSSGPCKDRGLHMITRAESGTSAASTRVTSAACPAEEEIVLENGVHTGVWAWEHGAQIAYHRVGERGPPVLLVHGFGVGGFHFHANMLALADTHRVWAIDLLGQGGSWFESGLPSRDIALAVSVDTWTSQLLDFMEAAAPGEPAVLGGNSLGGYLSVSAAARAPHAVAGLLLLNATPFWGFAPATGPLAGVLPWGGELPPPRALESTIEKVWFDRLRDPANVKALINLVYADPSKADAALISSIVDAAQHPQAPAAFASIVFSPKAEQSFDEMLDKVECPVALVYGKEDPWVVPLWGQRLKRRLPQAEYYEISPAGHCPHHEVPNTVNRVLCAWLEAQASEDEGGPPLAVGESWEAEEDGKVVRTTHVDGSPRNPFEWFDFGMFKLRSLGSS